MEKGVYRCKYGETGKLNHLNYSQWCRDIQFLLQAERALPIVLGEEVRPEGRNANASDFDQRSGIGAAMIHASCEDSVKAYLYGMRDPRVMWLELKDKLDTVNSRAGRTALLRRFNQLRPTPNQSISTYITELLSCSKELAGSEQEIPKETFVSHLLTTLPKEFDSIIDIITHRPAEEQSTDRVIATLIEWESINQTRRTGTPQSTNSSSTMLAPAALVTYSPSAIGGRPRYPAKFRNQPAYRRPSYNRNVNSRTLRKANTSSCWYCLKSGHQLNGCWLRQQAERAKRERERGRSGSQRARKDEEEVDAAFASVKALVGTSKRLKDNSKGVWIVDSGASHHLCSERTSFDSLKRLDKLTAVSLGDGSSLYATGHGHVNISIDDYCLSIQALYVPGLTYNLLSVGALSVSNRVSFGQSLCLLEPEDGKAYILAVQRNGLYYVAGTSNQSVYERGAIFGGKNGVHTSVATHLPSLELWHQRFAHLNETSLKGLLPATSFQLNATEPQPNRVCEVCIKSKHTRKVERKPAPRTMRPFELLHSDLCGPIVPSSHSGYKYFILYIDDYSRTTWVFFLQTKSSTEVVSVFQEFQAQLDKRFPQWPITRFRCDNGRGEYDNSLFRGILRVCGITFEPSPPYTQSKNGVAERMIRTIVTKARALLIDSLMVDEFWAEAINTAVYLHMRTPSQALAGITPYEKLHKKKPELGHLRRFGCLAFKLIPKELRKGKFTERSKRCIFLGYVHDTTGIWRLWDPAGSRIVQASDIVFDESKVLGTRKSDGAEVDILKACVPDDMPPEEESDAVIAPHQLSSNRIGLQSGMSDSEQPDSTEKTTTTPEIVEDESERPEFNETQAEEPTEKQRSSPNSADHPMANVDDCEEASPAESIRLDKPSQDPITLRRSQRLLSNTKGHPHAAIASTSAGRGFTVAGPEDDPISYREALRSHYCANWKSAMREEFRSLIDNKTWSVVLISDINNKHGIHPIGCKWVFRMKTNPDSTIRFKARLVVKGYEQQLFGETFAPVAGLTSIRMVLALAALNRWEIHHLDVCTAFLNPPLESLVYMEMPEGIDWLQPQTTQPYSHTKYALKLHKALYGLKEAPRLWYNHINKYLHTIGLQSSPNDPNLYRTEDSQLLLVLYVDDLLILSPYVRRIDALKAKLQEMYKMNDLGTAKQFLGLELVTTGDCLYLHQNRFARKILRRFGMDLCNGVSTPLEVKQLLPTTEDCLKADQTEYQSILGSLMYLAVGTRPDISYAVSRLGKFSINPSTIHLAALKRLLRYVKQTASLGLCYHRQAITVPLASALPIGFCDSDFAGDQSDSKSTSGYVFTLAGAAISWKSKKQTLVSLSSTESEYIGYSEAAREAIWLRRLYHEITATPSSSQLLYGDNMGALHLIQQPRFNARSKHIAIQYHHVRDSYQKGLISFQYLSTTDNTADILTKPLTRDTHQRHTQGLGLQSVILHAP